MNKLINFLGQLTLVSIIYAPLATFIEYVHTKLCPTFIDNHPIWFKMIFLLPIAILIWGFVINLSEVFKENKK